MNINGTLKSYKLLEHRDDYDVLELAVDLNTIIYIGQETDLIDFIGKPISLTCRTDLYKGMEVLMVAEVAEVHNFDKTELTSTVDAIKSLVTPDTKLFHADAVKVGQSILDVNSILMSYEANMSDKASWFDCKLMDNKSHIINAKFFTADSNVDNVEACLKECLSKYVQISLKRDKWGFHIISMTPKEVYHNDTAAVNAITLINNLVSNNELVSMKKQEWLTALENLKGYVYNIPGGFLVDIALCLQQLEIYSAFAHLSKEEYNALQLYFLGKYMYVLKPSPLAPVIGNVLFLRSMPEYRTVNSVNILASKNVNDYNYARCFEIINHVEFQVKVLWHYAISPESEIIMKYKEKLDETI